MSRIGHSDLIKIRQYRAKALEAAERAAAATDAFLRTSWDNIARAYHDMAERLERKLNP